MANINIIMTIYYYNIILYNIHTFLFIIILKKSYVKKSILTQHEHKNSDSELAKKNVYSSLLYSMD